jgi:hypothetical protein
LLAGPSISILIKLPFSNLAGLPSPSTGELNEAFEFDKIDLGEFLKNVLNSENDLLEFLTTRS